MAGFQALAGITRSLAMQTSIITQVPFFAWLGCPAPYLATTFPAGSGANDGGKEMEIGKRRSRAKMVAASVNPPPRSIEQKTSTWALSDEAA